jgi:DNA polymerase-1
MESTRELAREQGYVETVFGRRLYLPDINASNMQRRQYAERTAINAPMQGTAADIIKRAMINLDAAINTQQRDIRMIMQVHDELVFEVNEGIVEDSVNLIRDKMVSAAELTIPLVVDVGVGENWDEAH